MKEKTSPREERATKVLPQEAILRMLGFAPTCDDEKSQRRAKGRGERRLT